MKDKNEQKYITGIHCLPLLSALNRYVSFLNWASVPWPACASGSLISDFVICFVESLLGKLGENKFSIF